MSFLVHKNFFGFRPLVCQFAPVSARKIEFFVNLDGGSCRTTFGSTKRLQNNTLHKSWWDLPFLCFTLQLLLFLCWHSEKKSIKPEAWRIDLFASFLPPFPFTTKLSKSPSFFSLETAGAFAERKKKKFCNVCQKQKRPFPHLCTSKMRWWFILKRLFKNLLWFT